MRRTRETFGPYHYTSANCMTLYKRHAKPGCSVLDMGTGTGILAIKAKEYGAGRVLAVDAMPSAIEDAKANCEGTDIEVRAGYLNWGIDERFDVTLANLDPAVAEEYLQYAERTMSENGILILTWPKIVSYFVIEEYFQIIDCAGEDTEFPTYALRRREKCGT